MHMKTKKIGIFSIDLLYQWEFPSIFSFCYNLPYFNHGNLFGEETKFYKTFLETKGSLQKKKNSKKSDIVTKGR